MTLPSATEGCDPFSQPGASVSHIFVGGHDVDILVPASPWKRNQPGPSKLSHFIETVAYVVFLSAEVRVV